MDHTRFGQSTPPRRRSIRNDGFTIMEVALASFVMALGLSTSIIAMQTGYKYLDVARDTTLASQILQSEIERVRMMSWDHVSNMAALSQPQNVDLTSMFTAGTSETATEAEKRFAALLAARFKVARTVIVESGRPAGAGFAVITVKVAWTSFDGRSLSRQFQARYAQNGLYDYFYTLARPPT